MKISFVQKISDAAIKGSAFGMAAAISLTGMAYALTYNWSDPSGLRGKTSGDQIQSVQWNTLVTNVDNLNERLTNAESALSAISGGTPTGAVVAFFGSSCPSGWSPANGTVNGVKRTDGASGTLDLRGEFIRGLDGGRGVDSGRTMGSTQAETRIRNYAGGNGALSFQNTDSATAISNQEYATIGSALTPAVMYGVRPRNVALLYCVKN